MIVAATLCCRTKGGGGRKGAREFRMGLGALARMLLSGTPEVTSLLANFGDTDPAAPDAAVALTELTMQVLANGDAA